MKTLLFRSRASAGDESAGPILEGGFGLSDAPPSLRQNVAWTLAGNVIYAGCQWAMLIVLARLTSPQVVGQFALALAIAGPVVILFGLQLRSVQATDAAGRFAFPDYLALRLSALPLAFVSVIGILLLAGTTRSTALVVTAMTGAKVVEGVSDIFHGYLQRHERMEVIAKSSIAKGVLSLAAFSTALYLTGQLLVAVLALALAWGTVLSFYDIPRTSRLAETPSRTGRMAPRWNSSRLSSLVLLAWPLGLAAVLSSLNTNVPRYFLEAHVGEGAVGIFSALAYFIIAGVTAANALGQSAMPRLAKFHAAKDHRGFGQLVVKLLIIVTGVGVVSIVVAVTVGRPLLGMVYGPEYAAEAELFAWIMTAGALGYIAMILGNGVLACRMFRQELVLLAIVTAVITAACAVLIGHYGLMGAAWAAVIGAGVHVFGGSIIVLRELLRMRAVAGATLRSVHAAQEPPVSSC